MGKAVNDHGTPEFKTTCIVNDAVYKLVMGLVDSASVDPFAATEADRKKMAKIHTLLLKATVLASKLTK